MNRSLPTLTGHLVDDQPCPHTFDTAARLYRRAGWPVFPLQAGTKSPPPEGVTGRAGDDADDVQLTRWATERRYAGTAQLALRMPPGVVALDVDAYGTKTGAETLAEAARRWGALPATWRSSARLGDPISGHRFYRVPEGVELAGVIEFRVDGRTLGGVELVQRHHRFAVAWPSTNPHHHGAQYVWTAPYGVPPSRSLPRPGELPMLPPGWVDGLRKGPGAGLGSAPATDAEAAALVEAMPDGTACRAVADRLWTACQAVADGSTGRHDATLRHVLTLLRLGERGHTGAGEALGLLAEVFVDAVTADGTRDLVGAGAEFERMRTGALGTIAATPTEDGQRGCDCAMPERPVTRERVAGLVDRVVGADAAERAGLVGWATRTVEGWVARGALDGATGQALIAGLEGLR